MIFIFGGAYQGKLEYAKKRFGGRVYECCDSRPDFQGDIIDNLEAFVYACIKEGEDAEAYLKERWEDLKEKVVICEDVSQGIVPIEEDHRMFREINGRIMIALAGEAREVVRVFCGLPHILKKE